MGVPSVGRFRRRALCALMALALFAPILAVLGASPASAETFPPRYVRSIGGSGRPGVFSWGVQWNPVNNEILVGDYLHFKVRRYDLQGNHLGDFWREGACGQPYTIAVDTGGPSPDPTLPDRQPAIYVAELKDNPFERCIAKYDINGNFIQEINVGGGLGVDTNTLNTWRTSFTAFYPVWMTVEEDTGDIFVLDSHYSHTDQANPPEMLQLRTRIPPAGSSADVMVINEWPIYPPNLPNPCTSPIGCAPRIYGVDIVTDPGSPYNDMLFLSDAWNRRAYRYTKNGTYLSTFGTTQTGGDNRGIVVNEALGRLYLVDAQFSDIDMFNLDGGYLGSFSDEGNGPGEFSGGGRAVDIDAAGNVWVGDFGGFETEKFSPTGTPLLTAPFPARKPPVGLLGQPRDVAVDDQSGEVWVADAWNQRFSRFSPTGAHMGTWGERGAGGPFQMNYPRHIGIQPANGAGDPGPDHPKRVWVVNERGHHVQVYNYPTTAGGAPTYVTQIGEIGQDNVEPGHFRWPLDPEFYRRADGTEVVVFGDRMAASVKVFRAVAPFDEILLDAEGDGPLIARPNHGTAIDPVTGDIFIVNPSNDRIERVDQAGTPVVMYTSSSGAAVNHFGTSGTANGGMRDPVDATIFNGIIYVSDEGLSRLTAFRISDGAFLGRWGSTYGSNIYDFKGAVGVDTDAQGRLYVTDTGNDRIQVFDPNLGRQFETVAPALPTVTAPAQSANLPLGPVNFTGTATDNVAVGQVEVSVQDYTSGLWWNAFNQSWEAAQSNALAGWSGNGATNVSWRWTFLGVSAGGRYVAHIKTRDHNGNLSQAVARSFAMPGATPPPVGPPPVLDTERPNGIQDFPEANQVFPRAPLTITGTATDNVGVTSVRIAIKNLANNQWLVNPNSSSSSSFSTTFTWHEATLDTPGGTSTGWSFLWANPRSTGGNWQTLVEARDAAGNVDGSKPQIPFSTTNLAPDTTAPETVVSAPAPGAVLTEGPVVISGSATDNQSVAGVDLTIQNASGLYWTGSTFSSTATTVPAVLATPNTASSTWSYSFGAGANGDFTVGAAARDATGAVDATPATTSFTLDAGPQPDGINPDGTVSSPTANQSFANGPITFTGNATDNVGVSSVQIALRNVTTGQWWNGVGWTNTFSWFANTTLSDPGAQATGWSYTWTPPIAAGSFSLQVRANDAAGNFDQTRPNVPFSVAAGDPGPGPDTIDPDGTVSVPTQDQVFPTTSVGLSGNATDNVGVSSVQLAIRNRTTLQWWNGTGWQGGFVWFTTATLANPGASATGWSLTWTAPGSGLYLVQVRANDAAGNFDEARPSVRFSVS